MKPERFFAEIEALKKYLEEGKKLGCPQEQMRNFVKAGFVLQPKQLEMSAAARACDHRCKACEAKAEAGEQLPAECPDCGPTAVGVGGARGGGKSQWMFAQVTLDDCQRFAGLKCLYLRKTAKALREQIRDLLKKTCQMVKVNYREQVGVIEFPNGSFIVIGHFKDESEIQNYLGQEYDLIAGEELTTLSYEKWKDVMSCLRTSKRGWRPRLYAAWNWGGVGHFWVKKIFYDTWKEGKQRETRYILATSEDNAHLNPEYRNVLKSYTGWKYQSWCLGDPNFLAGQFFTNWHEPHHVFPNQKVNFNPMTDAVSFFGSYDYGFRHPSCFHLHARDVNGRIYTLDEWHESETVIEEQAGYMKDLCSRYRVEASSLEFIAAGKDCFNRKPDGLTIAQEFENHGITLMACKIDRVNAWAVMTQRLGDAAKGFEPTWFVHRKCENLIAQVGVAQHHEKKIGDVAKMNADENGEGGDDALECVRNGLVMAQSGVLQVCRPVALGNYQPIMIELGAS